MLCATLVVAALVATAVHASVRPFERFEEALTVVALPDLLVALRFTFEMRKVFPASDNSTHFMFESFPKSLAQIFGAQSGVTKLDLVMTTGRWRFDTWGPTMAPSVETGSNGLQVRALVDESVRWNNTDGTSDSAWTRAMRSLAGATCASLTLLEKPERVARLGDGIYVAALDSESVCSENLEPWTNRLPCRDKAGLGRAIVPLRVANARYFSLSVQITKTCLDGARVVENDPWRGCELRGLEAVQALTVVHERAPTLTQLLAAPHGFKSTCALASSSLVRGLGALPKLLPFDDINLASELPPGKRAAPALVSATKRLTGGTGDIRGSIAVHVCVHASAPRVLAISVAELVPSFLRVRWRTLVHNAMEFSPRSQPRFSRSLGSRDPPSVIAFSDVPVPPGACLNMSYAFDKAFLPVDAFPPDANRGFDVSPCTFDYASPGDDGSRVLGASNALIVSLPLPDFSMPYNVITLSSTAFAFFLGTVVNALTRVRADPFAAEAPKPDSIFVRIRRRLHG